LRDSEGHARSKDDRGTCDLGYRSNPIETSPERTTRRHAGDGNDSRVQAREKRDDEVKSRPEEKERAVTDIGMVAEVRRDCTNSGGHFAPRERLRNGFAVAQERVAPFFTGLSPRQQHIDDCFRTVCEPSRVH
jgi:hypothetical protein